MLKISNLQFLYREHGIFDKMFAAKTTVTLQINDEFEFFKLDQKSSSSKIVWNTIDIPSLQVPQHRKQNELNFQLYKDNHYVGKARSFVQFGKNKKGKIKFTQDCLDIVNKNFQIVGKLLYEARWIPKSMTQKMITLQQYYREGKATFNPNPYTTVGLERDKIAQQLIKKPGKLQRPNSIFEHNQLAEQEEIISCFSCFSCKKSISQMDQIQLNRLKNYPILYKESQIQLVKEQNLFTQTIQKPMYYSKKFYRTKHLNF